MFLEEVFEAITNDKIADYRKGQFAFLSFHLIPPAAFLHPLGLENHCGKFCKLWEEIKMFFFQPALRWSSCLPGVWSTHELEPGVGEGEGHDFEWFWMILSDFEWCWMILTKTHLCSIVIFKSMKTSSSSAPSPSSELLFFLLCSSSSSSSNSFPTGSKQACQSSQCRA